MSDIQDAPRAPLNAGQDAAANGFFEFLFSPEKEIGITGPGGVGKTFWMGHIIDEIIPRYHNTCKMMGIEPDYTAVNMTATTNKAAEVLTLATGRHAQTIHSFLNLKVQDDYENGRSTIQKTRAWTVHNNIILFIDECSMINKELYNLINEGTQNCKIVYVGDHCQLAPVTEKLSPVFRNGIQFFELTEPMRTKNPVLQALNQQLRNTVETGTFNPIKIVPGVIDHLGDASMASMLKQQFTQQSFDNRILAYTNKRVIEFNDEIRTLRNLPDEYTVGEILVNNSAIRLKTDMLSVEEEITIHKLSDPEAVRIDAKVELMVRKATISTRLGAYYNDVLLPVDRDHFSNLVKYYSGMKNWERYFHLKNTYPDLRQRDASTVYKAQGSSLDYVFIDLGDISKCRDAAQAARMLYVAFSRARKQVFVYGELAEKFGGLIY